VDDVAQAKETGGELGLGIALLIRLSKQLLCQKSKVNTQAS
jgi:hypothetical protein